MRGLIAFILRKPALKELPSVVPSPVFDPSHEVRADPPTCATPTLVVTLVSLMDGCCLGAAWYAV